MQLTASDLGANYVRHRSHLYYGKPTDIDWQEARKNHNGKTAKEIANALGISVTAVYQASYRGDIAFESIYKR